MLVGALNIYKQPDAFPYDVLGIYKEPTMM